jgi:hypothetical protein
MSEASDLEDEIRNSQAIIYNSQLNKLSQNYYIFHKNYLELKIPLENIKAPEISLPLWDVEKRSQLDLLQKEVVRRLFNYIISAKAHVDYTRNSITEWYTNTEFKKEYDKEVKARFMDNDLVGFIEDLRNYSSHYSPPIIYQQFTVKNINSHTQVFEHRFLLSKSILLEWESWKKGKLFLDKCDESIDVEKFVDDYFLLIDGFENWLLGRLISLHKKDLDWLEEKSKRLKELLDIIYKV